MEWNRVKNVFIGILAVVNFFLITNLVSQGLTNRQHAAALRKDLSALLEESGTSLDPAFQLPPDRTLPVLMLDRSRTEEEALAAAILGSEYVREESEEGTVSFTGDTGWMTWYGDGRVEASWFAPIGQGRTEQDLLRKAKTLTREWGLEDESLRFTVRKESGTVYMHSRVANIPVHNRGITIEFDNNLVRLSGVWTFGVPYTTANGTTVVCSAADALLVFATEDREIGKVNDMELGYYLMNDGGRRLFLSPTWEISTDYGKFLVDCAKKIEILG